MTLRLGAKRITTRGPLPVIVTNANGFAISGRLSGRTAAAPRLALAARTLRVHAAAKTTVRLALRKRVRERLARAGRLTVRLRARVRDLAGHQRTVTKTVAVRLRGRR